MARNKEPQRVIAVLDEHQFIPTGSAYIRTLPIEITERILSLAIDTSKSPIDQQWHRIYQANSM